MQRLSTYSAWPGRDTSLVTISYSEWAELHQQQAGVFTVTSEFCFRTREGKQVHENISRVHTSPCAPICTVEDMMSRQILQTHTKNATSYPDMLKRSFSALPLKFVFKRLPRQLLTFLKLNTKPISLERWCEQAVKHRLVKLHLLVFPKHSFTYSECSRS